MRPIDCNAEGAAITHVLQALAVMEERQGNKEAAIALLERALKQDPIHVHSWQASRSSLSQLAMAHSRFPHQPSSSRPESVYCWVG